LEVSAAARIGELDRHSDWSRVVRTALNCSANSFERGTNNIKKIQTMAESSLIEVEKAQILARAQVVWEGRKWFWKGTVSAVPL
jgi:hypothetical protein